MDRMYMMSESLKVIFSFGPHHEDVINKPPPDVRFERGVFVWIVQHVLSVCFRWILTSEDRLRDKH